MGKIGEFKWKRFHCIIVCRICALSTFALGQYYKSCMNVANKQLIYSAKYIFIINCLDTPQLGKPLLRTALFNGSASILFTESLWNRWERKLINFDGTLPSVILMSSSNFSALNGFIGLNIFNIHMQKTRCFL